MALKFFHPFRRKRPTVNHRANFYRAMLRKEAELGGTLFGPIPSSHRREFFCLDKYTWVWHEEWKDEDGKMQHMTTRYDIRASGVLKAQDGIGYKQISRQEAINLLSAIELYENHVLRPLYGEAVDEGYAAKNRLQMA
jgi:hypothetical protein